MVELLEKYEIVLKFLYIIFKNQQHSNACAICDVNTFQFFNKFKCVCKKNLILIIIWQVDRVLGF